MTNKNTIIITILSAIIVVLVFFIFLMRQTQSTNQYDFSANPVTPSTPTTQTTTNNSTTQNSQTQNQNNNSTDLKTIVIQGHNVSYPSTWSVTLPSPNPNCKTITCETSDALNATTRLSPTINSQDLIFIGTNDPSSSTCLDSYTYCSVVVPGTNGPGIMVWTTTTNAAVISVAKDIVLNWKKANGLITYNDSHFSFDYPTGWVVTPTSISQLRIDFSTGKYIIIDMSKKCSQYVSTLTTDLFHTAPNTCISKADGSFLTQNAFGGVGTYEGYLVGMYGLQDGFFRDYLSKLQNIIVK